MERSSIRPFLIVILLMAVTSLACAVSIDVSLSDQSGIKFHLPDTVGEWSGNELRFCQNKACGKTFMLQSLEHPQRCPDCESNLDPGSWVERAQLPADTGILKKAYAHPAGPRLNAGIVLSGGERVSIHRPEFCLAGQGSRITGSLIIKIPLQGREPLRVKVLELDRQIRRENGQTYNQPTFYAYWFVGKERETPSHYARMFWMAADRMLFNVAHRWAYISVSGVRQHDSEAHLETIKAFIRDFYPQLAMDAGA